MLEELLLPCFGAILFAGIQAIIIETPINIAVVEGSSIKLNCTANETDLRIRWFHRGSNSSRETMIYSGSIFPNNDSNYLIGKANSGEYSLLINSTSMLSAGMYKCSEFKTKFNVCAEVTILASKEPVCNFSVIYSNMSEHIKTPAGGSLTLWCRNVYHGNWAPTLKILNQTVAIESSHITITGEDVTAMVTVPLEACDNNRSYKFQCIVTFERSQNMPRNGTKLYCTYATNIPDYFVSIDLEYPQGAGEYQSTATCDTISTTRETKNKDHASLQVAAICTGVVLFLGIIGLIVLLVHQHFKRSSNVKLSEPDIQTSTNSSVQQDDYSFGVGVSSISTNESQTCESTVVVEDGTEYVDMGVLKTSEKGSKTKLRLHSDEYASIDHTVTPEKPDIPPKQGNPPQKTTKSRKTTNL